MPEEFEGDLGGAVFWGADLTGARFRDVNLTDVTISHAWMVNVDIDAMIDRVVVNGVDVTDFVNERDPWYPLRAMLRPSDPEGVRVTWASLQHAWAATITRAHALPVGDLGTSVNGEWSFVDTLRHLVFAMDKWFTSPVMKQPFNSIGLTNRGSAEFPWPDLDRDADPSVGEAIAARTACSARFEGFLASLTADDLGREVDVLENGLHPLSECIFTVFEEEFWHNRYALRDLAAFEAAQ